MITHEAVCLVGEKLGYSKRRIDANLEYIETGLGEEINTDAVVAKVLAIVLDESE